MASPRPLPAPLVLLLVLFVTALAAQERLGPDGVRERDPVIAATGKVFFFTRPDHPRNQGTDDRADVWFRRREADGRWGRALNPGSPVNTFGDDRPLGCSIDGERLAVLRAAPINRIELLERTGRSWQLLAAWSLPADIADPAELTFNATGQELIYAREDPETGTHGLYQRAALPGGRWDDARPLAAVNGPRTVSKPQLGADGRTLYFRRDGGQWYRQADRGAVPAPVDLPPRYLQLAATDELLVATTDDLGQDEHLLLPGTPPGALCPPGTLTYGTLGNPPAAGRATVDVPLSSGRSLRVRPDVLQRYAVVVRHGEVAFPESAIPAVTTTQPAGSLASLPDATTADRTAALRRRLREREQRLQQLDNLRRQRYTELLTDADGDGPYVMGPDTVPPADSAASFRDRYADDLRELERMKEKFRRQQEDRLRNRDRGQYLDLYWSEGPPIAAPTDTTARVLDTESLRSGVRSGLYPFRRADLDADYAHQLRELEALRAQLREVNAHGPVTTTANKGVNPASGAPPPSPATSAVTFIPHTAYPNAAGYDALDRLAERVHVAGRAVEIRVHTAADLPAREAQLLSEERAATIRNFLREAGISTANFRVTGYGNHQPEMGESVRVIYPD